MNNALLDIVGHAAVAGALVLTTHILLGRQVLQRGIIFIDLAVAQAAALGAVIGSLWLNADHGWLQQAIAAIAALAMVSGLHYLEKRWPDIQEALIGASFVLLACAALLITASDPQGGEHIHDLMAGQILWANNTQLFWLGLATLASLACMALFSSPLLRFYIPFALAVTAAVQVVGVYLVFASLIFPALACRKLQGKAFLAGAMLIGLGGYLAGLGTSLATDLPTGPTIVVTLAAAALLGAALTGFAQGRSIRYNRADP
ncbi:MAG: metal ABC transporter permease [Alcanivoracaceae bacterium]|jgi:zinc/manganese transport system permease protein|nr:metal ABC transporter permease [Alcanivoracaceae bacterium]